MARMRLFSVTTSTKSHKPRGLSRAVEAGGRITKRTSRFGITKTTTKGPADGTKVTRVLRIKVRAIVCRLDRIRNRRASKIAEIFPVCDGDIVNCARRVDKMVKGRILAYPSQTTSAIHYVPLRPKINNLNRMALSESLNVVLPRSTVSRLRCQPHSGAFLAYTGRERELPHRLPESQQTRRCKLNAYRYQTTPKDKAFDYSK